MRSPATAMEPSVGVSRPPIRFSRGRLPRPRRPHQGQEVALRDLEVDAAQDVDPLRPAPEDLVDVADVYERPVRRHHGSGPSITPRQATWASACCYDPDQPFITGGATYGASRPTRRHGVGAAHPSQRVQDPGRQGSGSDQRQRQVDDPAHERQVDRDENRRQTDDQCRWHSSRPVHAHEGAAEGTSRRRSWPGRALPPGSRAQPRPPAGRRGWFRRRRQPESQARTDTPGRAP